MQCPSPPWKAHVCVRIRRLQYVNAQIFCSYAQCSNNFCINPKPLSSSVCLFLEIPHLTLLWRRPLSSRNQFIDFRLFLEIPHLTLLWRRPLSYRNQSIDLRSKSMDWFLYDSGLRYERVNLFSLLRSFNLFNQKLKIFVTFKAGTQLLVDFCCPWIFHASGSKQLHEKNY